MKVRKPPQRVILRKKIKSKFGTLAIFAYNAGVSPSLVSLVCNGLQDVGVDRAAEWSKMLGAKVGDIFPELKSVDELSR